MDITSSFIFAQFCWKVFVNSSWFGRWESEGEREREKEKEREGEGMCVCVWKCEQSKWKISKR